MPVIDHHSAQRPAMIASKPTPTPRQYIVRDEKPKKKTPKPRGAYK